MLRRNRFFRDRAHPFDTDIRWSINFREIQIKTRTHHDHNRQHWKGYCDQQSDRFLKLSPLLQVPVTRRHFVSSGSFQDVRGELIEEVQNCHVQSPPCISHRLWGAFRICMIIQEMKIAEKSQNQHTQKSVQQTTDGYQPTKSAANQYRIYEVICNAVWVKQWISPI